MRRDELLRQIAALPENVDVGVQVVGEALDIVGSTAWGGGAFIAIRCATKDLQDMLVGWGVPADRRGRVLAGEV